jgi:hypothetical protein
MFSSGSMEITRARAEACQSLVEAFLKREISGLDLARKLRESGASVQEAKSYIEQAAQRAAQAGTGEAPATGVGASGSQDEPSITRETTPEGLTDDELADFRDRRTAALNEAHRRAEETNRVKVAEAIEWANLGAKIAQLGVLPVNTSPSVPSDSLATLLGLRRPSAALLSPSLLTAAPHLAHLSSSTGDSHIDKTCDLRSRFAAEKDTLVELVQRQHFVDPVPRSLWRLIVQDRYVDFEKLFSALVSGYDHYDDPTDFHGGYVLIKKDQATARKPVESEADWLRCFHAWKAAVCFLYPHRADELTSYGLYVADIFHATPGDPLVAIGFDRLVREQYDRGPFRLDDHHQTNLPLFSVMHRPLAKRDISSISPSASMSSASPAKRPKAVCINWNRGRCPNVPCPNSRVHGVCTECNANHQAFNNPVCKTSLQARLDEKETGKSSDS